MAEIKNKEMSKVFGTPDVKNTLTKGVEAFLNKPQITINNKKNSLKQKHTDGVKTIKKEIQATSHSEADVNWAMIANKITVANVVKGGLTLGGAPVGSLIGAGLGSGLGFAIGGPAGAVVGFKIGNFMGGGVGVIGGHKLGKIVANELEDKERKNIIETGTTKLNVDSTTKVNVEKRMDNDGVC